MNPFSRGVRNVARNPVRSIAVIIILGLSIGLCLVMLIAHKAVDNKIASVKSSIGNTITISPAGFTPGSAANNALSTTQLAKVAALPNVTGVNETLTERLSTTGSNSGFNFPGSSSNANATTSLNSPVTLNFNHAGGGGFFFSDGVSGAAPTTFSLPISFLGTNQPDNLNATTLSLTSGSMINPSSSSYQALISSAMASKNNLKVGSIFSAYTQSVTVAGIFSTSNKANEDTVIMSLPALESLSGNSGVVTGATVTVNSLDNLTSVTNKVKSTLGSSADVTSAEQQADNTVAPLNSVKNVAAFSLIGAVIAGAIIILLIMVMVVRERKKEIGVVKAIGGSNFRIISEFSTEALTMAVAGAIIGLLIGVVAGQPVTRTLVSNTNTSTSTTASQFPNRGAFGGGGSGFNPGGPVVRVGNGGGGFGGTLRRNFAVRDFSDINAQIGWIIIAEGFGAAVLISIIGGALAAAMITKVTPSTAMREL